MPSLLLTDEDGSHAVGIQCLLPTLRLCHESEHPAAEVIHKSVVIGEALHQGAQTVGAVPLGQGGEVLRHGMIRRYVYKWPINVAPYHAVVVPINYKDETMKASAEKIYQELKSHGVEVILDDRDAKPGFKFKDWELIGIPYIITVGRLAGDEICEFKTRSTMEKVELKFDVAIKTVVEAVKNIK